MAKVVQVVTFLLLVYYHGAQSLQFEYKDMISGWTENGAWIVISYLSEEPSVPQWLIMYDLNTQRMPWTINAQDIDSVDICSWEFPRADGYFGTTKIEWTDIPDESRADIFLYIHNKDYNLGVTLGMFKPRYTENASLPTAGMDIGLKVLDGFHHVTEFNISDTFDMNFDMALNEEVPVILYCEIQSDTSYVGYMWEQGFGYTFGAYEMGTSITISENNQPGHSRYNANIKTTNASEDHIGHYECGALPNVRSGSFSSVKTGSYVVVEGDQFVFANPYADCVVGVVTNTDGNAEAYEIPLGESNVLTCTVRGRKTTLASLQHNGIQVELSSPVARGWPYFDSVWSVYYIQEATEDDAGEYSWEFQLEDGTRFQKNFSVIVNGTTTFEA